MICIAAALVSPVLGSEPDASHARKLLKSDAYTVTWGTPRPVDPTAELEIGDGYGHGFGLDWLRFRPGPDGVDVLSVKFDEGRQPYKSKWPPDRATVTVRRARMKADAYAVLLRELAAVDAATLKRVERDSRDFSSLDFWVHARLAAGGKALIDLDWAGYESTFREAEYAKPRAAVALARGAVEGLDFKAHAPTAEERGWASAKFARDWDRFKGRDFHWWVRERYIQVIGVVGDRAALPTLRDILAGDPPEGGKRGASDERCVYYAINAVTRLTGKDARDKPVEDMDLEKARRKVLDLLREAK